jgi:hypothetical protein
MKNTVGFRVLGGLLMIASLVSGCVAGSTIAHDDSPGSTQRESGPVLCRDGSTPPCNDRD